MSKNLDLPELHFGKNSNKFSPSVNLISRLLNYKVEKEIGQVETEDQDLKFNVKCRRRHDIAGVTVGRL